jgi:hypothetical protein
LGAATLVQSVSTVHASHAFEAKLQRAAVGLVHDELLQLHAPPSQSGCVPMHAPRSVAVQMAHVCVIVLHTGVAAVDMQVVELRQPTQRFTAVSQTGVPSEELHAVAFVAVHATQVRVVVLQAGVVSGHVESSTQATHVFVVTSHAGVAPMQALVSAAVHCTQLVPARHAGVAPGQRLQMPPSLPASGMTYASGGASGAQASKMLNASLFASSRTRASTGPASMSPLNASAHTGLVKSAQESVSRSHALARLRAMARAS